MFQYALAFLRGSELDSSSFSRRLIELFFVRSSVPHHHHHNHHHHNNRSSGNSSASSSQSNKSEVTSQGNATKESDCRNGCVANGHVVCDREHPANRTNSHTNNDRRPLSPLLALRSSPVAQSAHNSPTTPFAAGAPFVSAISSSQNFVYSSCSSSSSNNSSSSSSHCSSNNISNNHISSNHTKSNSITSSGEVVKCTPAGGAGGEKRDKCSNAIADGRSSGQQNSNSVRILLSVRTIYAQLLDDFAAASNWRLYPHVAALLYLQSGGLNFWKIY